MNIAQIRDKATPILHSYGVTKAAVFGSVARGDDTPTSDIDLLIELPRPIGLLPFIDLKLRLEDTFDRKVDLVEFRALHPRLKDRVLAHQVTIL